MSDERLESAGRFKLNDRVWFLDKNGKSRPGTVVGFGNSPASGDYAEIIDGLDRKHRAVLLDSLYTEPPDAPKVRTRSVSKKGSRR